MIGLDSAMRQYHPEVLSFSDVLFVSLASDITSDSTPCTDTAQKWLIFLSHSLLLPAGKAVETFPR